MVAFNYVVIASDSRRTRSNNAERDLKTIRYYIPLTVSMPFNFEIMNYFQRFIFSANMTLNAKGVGAEGLIAAAGTLAKPSEEFGNDERVEALWAMKAYEHAEVYFNILCSVDSCYF